MDVVLGLSPGDLYLTGTGFLSLPGLWFDWRTPTGHWGFTRGGSFLSQPESRVVQTRKILFSPTSGEALHLPTLCLSILLNVSPRTSQYLVNPGFLIKGFVFLLGLYSARTTTRRRVQVQWVEQKNQSETKAVGDYRIMNGTEDGEHRGTRMMVNGGDEHLKK